MQDNFDDESIKTSAPPEFSINSPINYTLYGKIAPDYNITITSGLGNYSWYEFIETGEISVPIPLNGIANEEVTGTFDQSLWDNLSNGTVTIRFYVNNSLGEIGQEDAIVRIDIIEPTINVLSPIGGYYNSTAPEFIVEILDPNLDLMWYTLNTNNTQYFFTNNESVNQNGWRFLLDGIVNITFYANDSVSNMQSTMTQVTKDTIDPVITINAPVVGVYNDAPAYDITITEDNLDQYWYTLNGGLPIFITSTTGTINSTEWGNQLDGSVDIIFYVNDSAGNEDSNSITVTKDTTDPAITINAPVVGVYNDAPAYDITITEDNLDQYWYTLNGGSTIFITSTTGAINSTEWGNELDGSVDIIFYANDSAGNVGSNSVTVTKDTTDPDITINAHVMGVYDNAPAYDITITEVNLDQYWYTLNGGSPIYIASLTGTIEPTEWGNQLDGSVDIIFYANDSAGNLGSSGVTVTKDTTDPVVTITAPIIGVYSDAPAYNISITEDNLDQYWYTLNGSSPIYIASTTGTIDPTEWGNLADGSVEIIFYANDSVGHQGLNTVTVAKDKTDPVITIIAPTPGIYSSAPAYNITITEDNLDQYWYTLNGGSPIYITSMTGTINSTEWGNLPDGSVEIIFYANDSAGNQGSSSVTVNKDTSPPLITIIAPAENSIWDIAPNITVSVTDPNFNSTWYCVNSTNGWSNNVSLINNQAQELEAAIWNNLPAEGMFQLFVFANDTLGNLNQTFITLFKDILAPRVIINSPSNLTYWNTRPPINVSAYDLHFDYILYQVEATAPIMINNNEEVLLDSDRWNNLLQGAFTISFFVYDTLGHVNDTFILTLYKDTEAPIIIINSPNNSSYWNTQPLINVTIYEQQLNSSWYRVYSSSLGWSEDINLINNTDQLLDVNIWNSLDQGEFQIYFYANDSFGYLNDFYNLTLYKDDIIPTLTVNLPLPGYDQWNEPPMINAEFFDVNNDTLWYRVYSTSLNWSNIIILTNKTDQLLDSSIWDNLAQGEYQLYIYANDTFGNINEFSQTLSKDTLAPIIINNSPLNMTYWNSTPPINVTVYDPNLGGNQIYYSVDEYPTSPKTLVNNTEQLLDSDIWNNLAQGIFHLRIYCSDRFPNHTGEIVLTLFKDTIAPIININSPNNMTYWNLRPTLNMEIYEQQLNSSWYRVYSSSLNWSEMINIANNTNYLLDQDIWNNLTEGEFQIHYYANDSFGNLDTKFLTLYKDTLAPDAPITLSASPSSWTNINNFSISWVNPSDTSGIVGAFYKLNGLPSHDFDGTYVNGTDIMSILGIIVSGDGTHDVYVWLIDDVGNINYNNTASTQLYLDTTVPTIVINDPDNYDVYGNETFNFDLTNSDPNLDTTWYSLYTDVTGWSINVSLNAGESNGTIDFNLWDACPNGTVLIRFYSNDTVGNMNFDDVTVYKDSIRPDITITLPILNQIFGSFPPDYDITIVEPHIYQKWYILINATNPSDRTGRYFFSADAGTILLSPWDIFENGNVTIRFYANDTLGNENFAEVTVEKDITAPDIMIEDPVVFDVFGYNAPDYTISTSGENIDTTWYIIFNAANLSDQSGIYPFTGTTGTIDQAAWDSFGHGQILIRFYINDSTGNENYDSVYVTKDILAPSVIVNLPINGTYWNTQPTINIDADDPALSSVWYRINSSVGWSQDITLLLSTDQLIDLGIWNSLEEGDFQIYIYANDTLGNVNDTHVLTLYKDITPPIITIISPSEGEGLGREGPVFEISIQEIFVVSRWYTIEGSNNNITFTGDIGRIDQTMWELEWDSLAEGGVIKIIFYARDEAGNIGSTEIEVTKYSYTPFNLLEVLGGPMGLILAAAVSGTMIPVTVGISKTRYYKSLNKKDRKKVKRIMLLIYTCLTFVLLTFVI